MMKNNFPDDVIYFDNKYQEVYDKVFSFDQ
jgi:hypothetical protein